MLFRSVLNDIGYNTTALTPKIFIDSELTSDFKNPMFFDEGIHDGLGEKILKIIINQSEPWFFFIHFLDIHGSAKDFPEQFNQNKFGNNQYERRISAMDIWFGKFFEKLNFENTIIIFTADHSTDRGIYTPQMEKIKTNLNKNKLDHIAKTAKKVLPNFLTKQLKNHFTSYKNKTKRSEEPHV